MRMPAVIVIQIAAATGAVDKNLTKSCISFLQNLDRDYLKLKGNNRQFRERISAKKSVDYYRGETVISLSLASNLPEVNSPKAAAGQAKPVNIQLIAKGKSMMISFSSGLLLLLALMR